jgi:hypothetical protein
MTRWFLECDPNDNEAVARFLSQEGIMEENMHVGLKDKDGGKHNLWEIPATMVTYFRDAKQVCGGQFHFRFWKRDTPHGVVYRADFLERRRAKGRYLCRPLRGKALKR